MKVKEMQTSLLTRTSLALLPRRARKLHHRWRLYDLASALVGSLALILAIVDYEHRWDDDRTSRTCRAEETSSGWRIAIAVLSFAAMSFATMRHIVKIQWLDLVNKSRQVRLVKPRAVVKLQFLLELCVFGVFPYPYLESTFHFYEPINKSLELVNVCYYWSEVLFILMFLRVIPLCRAILNFSKYIDDTAYAFCRDLDVKSNARFTFRCLVKDQPLLMLIAFLVPCILILSVVMRVFERPMEAVSQFNHRYYTNTLWLVAQTVFNVSYGDIYPSSTGGRFVSITASVLGVCAFSYIVFIIERTLSLTSKENKAYTKVNKSRAAALVILKSLKYYSVKRKYGADDAEVVMRFYSVTVALSQYRAINESLKSKTSIADEVRREDPNHDLHALLKKIDRKVNKIEAKLDKA
jgi:hypothetical protein